MLSHLLHRRCTCDVFSAQVLREISFQFLFGGKFSQMFWAPKRPARTMVSFWRAVLSRRERACVCRRVRCTCANNARHVKTPRLRSRRNEYTTIIIPDYTYCNSASGTRKNRVFYTRQKEEKKKL